MERHFTKEGDGDARERNPHPDPLSQGVGFSVRIIGKSVGISIIVPVYNNPSDLRECLSAFRSTSCPDWEIIVVDDASTDDSSSVAARMGARVLRLAENMGPAAARNYGARHARGDILFFVDADVVVA